MKMSKKDDSYEVYMHDGRPRISLCGENIIGGYKYGQKVKMTVLGEVVEMSKQGEKERQIIVIDEIKENKYKGK